MAEIKTVPAPELPYLPREPKSYSPRIGLIACGSITEQHLKAYRSAGYDVAALCDVELERAREKQELFYPEAEVYESFGDLLRRDDIEVVDVATHTAERPAIVEAALNAGKHVLSQKPFALDLDVARSLCDLADERDLKLAVNQNGRWAPHLCYTRLAIEAGLLGQISSLEFSVHFDHNWVVGTAFDDVQHLILLDFAIHWFDAAVSFLPGQKAKSVHASFATSPTQKSRQPQLAQAQVQFDEALASFVFNGDRVVGLRDETTVAGSEATLISDGETLQVQEISLYGKDTVAQPELKGAWFPDGFHGTMAELLCAIEEDRQPSNSARGNIDSLALCFAACASSLDGLPKVPGEVKVLH